ncbi:MAG: YafY family protein [Eubacteriales bacterium]
MKNDRLFQILYILLEKETATAPELAEKLEVSTRTIYRDVEALSMAGVPIYASAGKGGGISLVKEYAFDKALLSDDEQNEILFAIQSLAATDLKVDTLLSKLSGLFQKPDTDWIQVDFSRWGFNRVDNARFDTIKSAILKKQMLSIRYCGTSGAITERRIKPFKLVYKDKSWYLQAFCLNAQDYRLFKVSRVVEMHISEETFSDNFSDAPSVDIDAMDVVYTVPVKLLFSPESAFRVYDEFNQARIQEQSDSTILVTYELPDDDWVLQYLFSYGTSVRIIEPIELKDKMTAYAKNVYLHHKT